MIRTFVRESSRANRQPIQNPTGIIIVTKADRDGDHILLCILAELETFSTIDNGLFESNHPYVRTVQHVGIPYCPGLWFGGPLTGGRRKAISRATMKMARDRQVERITEKRRDRVTHLRLTPSGFKRAMELANGHCELGQLMNSLARIDWSDEIWNELDLFTLEQSTCKSKTGRWTD